MIHKGTYYVPLQFEPMKVAIAKLVYQFSVELELVKLGVTTIWDSYGICKHCTTCVRES